MISLVVLNSALSENSTVHGSLPKEVILETRARRVTRMTALEGRVRQSTPCS